MAKVHPMPTIGQPVGEGGAPWGSIEAVLSLPPRDVAPDETWCAIVLFYMTVPFTLIMGICGGICKCLYLRFSLAALWHAKLGRPFCLGPILWRYAVSGLVALVRLKKSRLAFFMWEREVCGGGDYFYQGEGVWTTTYKLCDGILRSKQRRAPAFACIRACHPDLFPTDLLINLTTGNEDSEWAALRRGLHDVFLEGAADYQKRLSELPERVAKEWPASKLDGKLKPILHRLVCKCIFFVFFGVWVEDTEADTLAGWRTAKGMFVLPRFVHRAMCNMGIKKVKGIRRATVALVEKYHLREPFERMNQNLPEAYRRQSVVQLCDMLLYAVGFAGVGGCCACVESVTAFLQLKTGEVPSKSVSFAKYPTTAAIVEAYRKSPEAFIKEVCRLDPPVTSATSVLETDLEVELAGRKVTLKEGMLRQYTIAMANRDPEVFADPEVFDPTRANLDEALTWNGQLGEQEASYPRICPGRYLSLQLARAIIDQAIAGQSSPA